jgi:hypothetical protein
MDVEVARNAGRESWKIPAFSSIRLKFCCVRLKKHLRCCEKATPPIGPRAPSATAKRIRQQDKQTRHRRTTGGAVSQ